METESSQLGSNGANESDLLPVDFPGGEMPASLGVRRGSSVKKHHHKHNLKHRYELLETLGRGTYGKVKKAIERHTGRVVSWPSYIYKKLYICVLWLKKENKYNYQTSINVVADVFPKFKINTHYIRSYFMLVRSYGPCISWNLQICLSLVTSEIECLFIS